VPAGAMMSAMHEMSIAIKIVELAEAEARAAGARRINRVEVEVGALAGVLADSLRFCFEAACRATLAEGAELAIVEIAGLGQCASCGEEGPLAELLALCPACGGFMRPLKGRELRLLSLNIDEREG